MLSYVITWDISNSDIKETLPKSDFVNGLSRTILYFDKSA